MESYQSIGIVMAVVGILVGLALAVFPDPLSGFIVIAIIFMSFIGLIISLVNPKNHKGVGITLIIVGVIGNLLLIIPGVMAIRYKPKNSS